MCTVLMRPGGYPTAVNKYIKYIKKYSEGGGKMYLKKHFTKLGQKILTKWVRNASLNKQTALQVF